MEDLRFQFNFAAGGSFRDSFWLMVVLILITDDEKKRQKDHKKDQEKRVAVNAPRPLTPRPF